MIKDFYDKERKLDLMPTIRVMTKNKELEEKRKLLLPLQRGSQEKLLQDTSQDQNPHGRPSEGMKIEAQLKMF